MRKTISYFSVFSILFGLFLPISYLFAYPNDAVTVRAESLTSGKRFLIATSSSAFTVLNVSLNPVNNGTQDERVECLTDNLTPVVLAEVFFSNFVSVNMSWVFPSNTSCYYITMNNDDSEAWVTYVPYDLSLVPNIEVYLESSSTTPNSFTGDELFIYTVIVFILSIGMWLFIFSPMKRL